MVGFNRRFAPHMLETKRLLAKRSEAVSIIITVNAGHIPSDHWTQDRKVGGGRIIGEACHFIDLARFLAGTAIERAAATKLRGSGAGCDDSITMVLGFANGSHASIQYLANGSKAFPKERVELFCGGGILQIDNFRKMRGFGWPGFSKMNLWSQDKGHQACMKAFLDSLAQGAEAPIPAEEIFEVSDWTLKVAEML